MIIRIAAMLIALLLTSVSGFSQQDTSLVTDLIDGRSASQSAPHVVSGTIQVKQRLEVPNCCAGQPRTLVYTAQLFGEHGDFNVANLFSAPTTFTIDTTQVPDGVYALTYDESDPTLYPIAVIIIVDNVPGPATVTAAPACGYNATARGTAPQGGIMTPACSLVPVNPRPLPGYPFPSGQATPYQAIPNYSDLIVEYVLPNWPLYNYPLMWFQSQHGEPFVQVMAHTGHRDFDEFKKMIDRRPLSDGPRGSAYVSGGITGAVHPVTGELFFVEKGAEFGRLGKIALSGTVTTLAGFRLKPNRLPYHPSDTGAPFVNQFELVGDFSSYPPGKFRLPMDLAFDLADPRKLYVADVDNGRIARVDLSAIPVKVYPHADGLDRPTSVQAGNGGVYFLERNLQQIKFIDAQGAISTSVSLPKRPINIRMAGHGPPETPEHIYIMYPDTGEIGHWNHSALTIVSQTQPDAWMWLESDRACALGPCGLNQQNQMFNQVFVAASYPSESIQRFNHLTNQWSAVTVANARFETRADNAAVGHYPWMIAAGADGSLWTAGFGTVGVQRIRLGQGPELPSAVSYQQMLTYARGQKLWYAGCGNGCAWGDFTGYGATHGTQGNGFLGFMNIEDLAALDEPALHQELLAGIGTGVARSFTSLELDDLSFFVRRASAYATRGLDLPGPPPNNQPPVAVAAAIPLSGEVPLTVSFDGSGSSDPEGDLLTYEWNFGDGNLAVGVQVTHTYTVAGTYTAGLTVDDGRGGTDVDTVVITPSAPPPRGCEGAECCGANTTWSGTQCVASCPAPIEFEIVKTGDKTAECRIK